MKIGLVCESCDNRTGIGRIVNSLAREFLSLGHEVSCAAQAFEGTDGRVIRRHVPAHTPSKAINKILFRLAGSPFSGSETDVTHAFGVGRDAQIVSAQSCHRAGIELLASFRNEFLERRNFGVYDSVSLHDEHTLLTSRTTRKIIAVSQLVKSQIENFYAVGQEHIAVIPNGVDLTLFERLQKQVNRLELRSSVGCSHDDFLLLFVGNEFGRKGLRAILRSLRALSDRRIRLLVVGRGNQKGYSRFAADLGVAENVFFVGSVPEPESLYFAADAFVFPSLYEPFGIVILEALAAGVPVVTSKMCGATEEMQHRQHVLHLDDPTSIEELNEAIRLLMRNESVRRTMIDSGKEKVREYSWDRIARRMVGVYHEVRQTE